MARRKKQAGMTAADFRRIALSLEWAEQGSHMGAVDFRVGGRIFATLAHKAQGYGNLMLKPEEQKAFVEELPDVFVPIAGGWGRMGATHIVLAKANEDLVRGALQTAWRLRVEANARSRKRPARTTRDTAPSRRRTTLTRR
jgi:hypothetical protein